MPFKRQMEKDPTKVIELAVKRMLDSNRLRSPRLRRLKVYAGTETTAFANSSLPKDNWLYLDIVQKDVGEIVPKEGDPLITPREGDPASAPADGEILGLLTITITCIIR